MNYEPPINLAELDKPDAETHPLFAFGNWRTNFFLPPLLMVAAWLAQTSSLGFLLQGFHVWMHEFGHATAAWLCGRRATPLPMGWTPVEPEYSPFVYWGLLLLFVILFAAGWKERKVWPMLAAVALAGLQFYMTWVMPEDRQEFWYGAFGGVGGEFYLSTLLMVSFYVQLPDKFRWGLCRYVFFFIGASAFLHIVNYWDQIYHGQQDIPMGSMINGEDDSNGDMNKLMNDYLWSADKIRYTYQYLGYWCWGVLGVVYLAFVLRANLLADWVSARMGSSRKDDD
ncbi:MAG TPA: M50 family metallopeptidase [Opitutales bacterium]|nr:M50 family metallopeptidase [Opitutales bacterium]